MPGKSFWLNDNTKLVVYKRRTSRNIKLSISPKGEVRVSIPKWTPYSAGVAFAKSKETWITKHLPEQIHLYDGQLIGKKHYLKFQPVDGRSISTRLNKNQIFVNYPTTLTITDSSVQAKANSAAIRALRKEAEEFLPRRTEEIAQMFGYNHKEVKIRLLKGRWGSCDQNKNITLNLYLMQVSDTLIDYVILHELVHTIAHNHGPDFWEEMHNNLPNAKTLKKQLRAYQPTLNSDNNTLMA